MTDRPILFSAPMVRALIEGRKTQTRRVLKPQPQSISDKVDAVFRYAPGDRLWVKETHQFRGSDYDNDGEIEWYRCYSSNGAADNWDPEFPHGWVPSPRANVRLLTDPDDHEDGIKGYVTKRHPSLFMPRWASRLTLLVTQVRVERLQNCSEVDAIAEGCGGFVSRNGEDGVSPQEEYRDLWDQINGPGAWAKNPWIVAVSFTVHQRNIDQMAGAMECP